MLVKDAATTGIVIDEISFIETAPIQTIEVQQQIEQALRLTATVVFTSMNAVDAVTGRPAQQQPNWDIYCIGTTTHKLVKENFGEESIAGAANSAAELAALIAADRFIDEVTFFCGDQRRDELPEMLRQNNIEVSEIIVYQTIEVPRKIKKPYHGILFFSPSAVESFFKINTVPAQTILFAIGNTTATAIKKFSSNKIIISSQPGKENLVKTMIAYFN